MLGVAAESGDGVKLGSENQGDRSIPHMCAGWVHRLTPVADTECLGAPAPNLRSRDDRSRFEPHNLIVQLVSPGRFKDYP